MKSIIVFKVSYYCNKNMHCLAQEHEHNLPLEISVWALYLRVWLLDSCFCCWVFLLFGTSCSSPLTGSSSRSLAKGATKVDSCHCSAIKRLGNPENLDRVIFQRCLLYNPEIRPSNVVGFPLFGALWFNSSKCLHFHSAQRTVTQLSLQVKLKRFSTPSIATLTTSWLTQQRATIVLSNM